MWSDSTSKTPGWDLEYAPSPSPSRLPLTTDIHQLAPPYTLQPRNHQLTWNLDYRTLKTLLAKRAWMWFIPRPAGLVKALSNSRRLRIWQPPSISSITRSSGTKSSPARRTHIRTSTTAGPVRQWAADLTPHTATTTTAVVPLCKGDTARAGMALDTVKTTVTAARAVITMTRGRTTPHRLAGALWTTTHHRSGRGTTTLTVVTTLPRMPRTTTVAHTTGHRCHGSSRCASLPTRERTAILVNTSDATGKQYLFP